MNNLPVEQLLRESNFVLILLIVGAVVLFAVKRILPSNLLLVGLLAIRGLSAVINTSILFYRRELGLDVHTAYKVLFYGYWGCFAVQAVLQVAIIYSVFHQAMKPMQGLQQIGKIIFRWVAGVSILVSLAFAAGPHLVNSTNTLNALFVTVVEQIQQGVSVLTLCLLLFVTFSTKPLGLTYRSRAFGIIGGLGILACTTLVQTAWTAVVPKQSLYSPVALFGVIGCIAAVSMWTVYYAMPEPAARMILLPTTSPFFLWNSISEALGDSPGHVAIAGFRPDMLASAELEMLTAPSVELDESYADNAFAPSRTPAMLVASAR